MYEVCDRYKNMKLGKRFLFIIFTLLIVNFSETIEQFTFKLAF